MLSGTNENFGSVNILDKNITSYNASIKSKKTFSEDSVRITHFYIQENLLVSNLDDFRTFKVEYDAEMEVKKKYISEEERKKMYNGEEDNMLCGRFPHLIYCGCKYPCSVILNKIHPIEAYPNIFVGPIEAAYKTKELLGLKIQYILNVSCTEYNKRHKYFKYLDIYINDNHTENAIKFFKITNRFIADAAENDKKILIHSVQGKSRCWVFFIAYLIARRKLKYIPAYEIVKEKFPYAEPNDNFLTQLKHYDLETNT